jgi:hypothetical protein
MVDKEPEFSDTRSETILVVDDDVSLLVKCYYWLATGCCR